MGRLFLLTGSLAGALVTTTLVLATASASPQNIPGGTIWVTERTPSGQSTVAAIDSATGDAIGITSVGDVPIGVTAPHGTDKVYSSDENTPNMSIIDKDTVTVIGTVFMGAGSRPHHLMASRNGHRIYVGEYGHNFVGVVDTRLDANVADYMASSNPGSKTHAVWITPNEQDLYATNEGPVQAGPGTFSKLNARTGELIWEHQVGNRPSEVLVDHDRAYVSIRNDHVIRVYDIGGSLPNLIGEAEAQFMPDTLSLTNDKRTLIVGLRGIPARMAFIDTHTLATTYLPLPGVTTGHQWLTRNGRFTFMALEGSPGPNPPPTSGQVAVIDNRSRSLATLYPYPNGKPRPHGVFYEPQRAGDDDDDDG
jgi:DNA-binding beta-propeller fold protein YncE